MSAVRIYFNDIWLALSSIAIGMRITILHLFVRNVTTQYPDVKLKLPERARNRLYVNIDDCIGCDQCSMACPVNCIIIETIKSTPDQDLGTTSTGQKKRLHVPVFDIDIAKCCYCGLCVPPCPTDCIVMTDVYEFSEFDRQNLIYNFSVMTPQEIEQAREKLKKAEEEAAAKKAAAAAAAAAAKAAAAQVPPAAPNPASENQTQQPSTSAPDSTGQAGKS
jgi:NADH-quinone oxidoreductase subunit I